MTPCHETCFRIVAFSYLFMLIFSLSRNLSCNGKDNPFCDICRMVPDSFKIFCNHQKVYCLFPFVSMISDKFNQFLFYFLEKIINHIIVCNDFLCLIQIFFYISLQTLISMTIVSLAISSMWSNFLTYVFSERTIASSEISVA